MGHQQLRQSADPAARRAFASDAQYVGGDRRVGNHRRKQRRELLEELGINTQPGELQSIGRLKRRNSFCDLWLLQRDVAVADLQLQREEVAEARWVTPQQFAEMVRQNRFHNYGKEYFDCLSKYLKQL